MAVAVPRSRSRNSAIELLRLLAMLMIVGYHYVRGAEIGEWGGDWVASQSISVKKFVYQFIFESGGWIGNCIFFTISVWFLVDRSQTLKGSLRRVWIMERELLFWSLLLLAASFGLAKAGWVHRNMLSLSAASIFPISLDLWWYATSYALFLLFLPFLMVGMKALTKNQHKTLALFMLIIWGLLGVIPHVTYDLTKASVFVFIYWFILITYYKWRMKRITVKQSWILIAIGVSINIVYWFATNIIFETTGRFPSLQNYQNDHWFISSMMIGFGVFSLAEKCEWHNTVVNLFASAAFGVYLIHTYWTIPRIWDHSFSIRVSYMHDHAILFGAGVILSIFIVCLLLSLLRVLLFKYTIDVCRGALFDKLWEALSKKLSRSSGHSSKGRDSEGGVWHPSVSSANLADVVPERS